MACMCSGNTMQLDTYGRLRQPSIAVAVFSALAPIWGERRRPEVPGSRCKDDGSSACCCFALLIDFRVLQLKRIGTRTRIRRLVGALGWHRAGMKCGSDGPNTHTRWSRLSVKRACCQRRLTVSLHHGTSDFGEGLLSPW